MNIFALSSGKGPSGIAIVRISGPQTLNICKSLTNEKNITNMQIKIEGLQGQVNTLTNNQKKIINLISKIEQVIEEWKEEL